MECILSQVKRFMCTQGTKQVSKMMRFLWYREEVEIENKEDSRYRRQKNKGQLREKVQTKPEHKINI